jgi:formylglycine-generating enzyme required for sulfatase activity
MVVVPAGEFMMGSTREEANKPQHKVVIGQPFAVSRFEVTFEEWDACAALRECADQAWDHGEGRGKHPVVNVSWYGAQQYVAWLSKRTGKSYRLLSEAEWEYAERAGSDKSYWDTMLGLQAICKDEPRSCPEDFGPKMTSWFGPTKPVGSFPPNKFDLYDMDGNVWEWTQDCPDSCVIRGGTWIGNPAFIMQVDSLSEAPSSQLNGLGVRVGRTLTPEPPDRSEYRRPNEL